MVLDISMNGMPHPPQQGVETPPNDPVIIELTALFENAVNGMLSSVEKAQKRQMFTKYAPRLCGKVYMLTVIHLKCASSYVISVEVVLGEIIM